MLVSMLPSLSVNGMKPLALILKKLFEDRHYNIAVSYAAKKLVQTIYRIEITNKLTSCINSIGFPFLLEYPSERSVCHAIFQVLIVENKSQPLYRMFFCTYIIKLHFSA